MEKAPTIKSHLLWEAFWDLATMRTNGMSVGSIPLDKIHWYASVELGLQSDELAAFVWIMRRTDAFFVNRQADKVAAENNKVARTR